MVGWKALEHTSVLILVMLFGYWQNTLGHNRTWIAEVVRALDEVSLDWVDCDKGLPRCYR